ncbi:MAG: CinA family nicotinamide mononucleotide deamidase-related protein [Verrucomicrobiota bacterium]
MSEKPNIEVLNLGDELLNGIRLNGHLTYIGSAFAERGLHITRASQLPDDLQIIKRSLELAWESADIIIITGGLGPTSDDKTRDAVSEFLNLRLNFSTEIEAEILNMFARRNRVMTDNNLRQCYVLEGAEVLKNPNGTAPGQYFTQDDKHLFLLPGPSNELHPMFENHVLPRLEELGLVAPEEKFVQIRTTGLGESMLEQKVMPILSAYPGIGIGYCAHLGLVDLRLSKGTTHLMRSQIEDIAATCRDELGEDFVCYGEQSIAEVVYQQLRATDRSFSTAESCTGGLLSNAFTDVPGASKTFAGSVVCYNNDAKIQMLDVPEEMIQQHGAVSRECAIAMVTGAAERFGTDFALSITGFAGPTGGTDRDPVGTIYIGYYSPSGVWSRKEVFVGDRNSIKTRAVHAALDLMRRKIYQHRIDDFVASEFGS